MRIWQILAVTQNLIDGEASKLWLFGLGFQFLTIMQSRNIIDLSIIHIIPPVVSHKLASIAT